MYRDNDRPPKEPTRIEYASQWVRPWFLLVGFLVFVCGAGTLAGLHATHLTCSRKGSEAGTCRVHRYGLFAPLDREVAVEEIARFDVKIVKGSKGGSHAELRLRMMRPDGGETIDLETGWWGRMSPADAEAANARFITFQEGRASSFDEWLSLGPISNIIMTLFGVGLAAMGLAFLREQLGQLRRIRILVDHDREVVVVRKQEIPFREIQQVDVQVGRALFWSSKKNEHVPGNRLALLRTDGTAIFVTKEFRAGPRQPHELARKQLLRAIGRMPDEGDDRRPRGKKKRG